MFYAAICQKCNTGLDGDRTNYGHEDGECENFQRIRRQLKLSPDIITDQLDLQKALEFEKQRGHLPGRKPE